MFPSLYFLSHPDPNIQVYNPELVTRVDDKGKTLRMFSTSRSFSSYSNYIWGNLLRPSSFLGELLPLPTKDCEHAACLLPMTPRGWPTHAPSWAQRNRAPGAGGQQLFACPGAWRRYWLWSLGAQFLTMCIRGGKPGGGGGVGIVLPCIKDTEG